MSHLSAAQRSKIRRLSRPAELAPDEEGGELNIVPFLDIIVNILIFVLATVAVTFTSTIETTPPASKSGGVRSAIPQESLNLMVLIVEDGFALKSRSGNIGPGCMGISSGLTLTKKSGDYDFAALNQCATKLKKSNPAYAEETQVQLSANPDIAYSVVVATIDALRTAADDKEPLFEDVTFGVKQ